MHACLQVAEVSKATCVYIYIFLILALQTIATCRVFLPWSPLQYKVEGGVLVLSCGMEYGEPHCELRQIPIGRRHIESIYI